MYICSFRYLDYKTISTAARWNWFWHWSKLGFYSCCSNFPAEEGFLYVAIQEAPDFISSPDDAEGESNSESRYQVPPSLKVEMGSGSNKLRCTWKADEKLIVDGKPEAYLGKCVSDKGLIHILNKFGTN